MIKLAIASEHYTLEQFCKKEDINKMKPNTGIIFTPEGKIIKKFETKNKNIIHSFSFPKETEQLTN